MRQIRVSSRALSDASGEWRLRLLRRANEARQTLDALLDDIAQDAPEYVDLRRGEPMGHRELQICLASR